VDKIKHCLIPDVRFQIPVDNYSESGIRNPVSGNFDTLTLYLVDAAMRYALCAMRT